MEYLSRRLEFSASGLYAVREWSEEQNRTFFGRYNRGHGHDYLLEVMVRGETRPSSGIVVNITDVDRAVKKLLEELDGKFLNYEHPHFSQRIPTTENILTYLWQALEGKFEEAELYRLTLHATRSFFSEMEGGHDMVRLSRIYHFSSSHRLHSEQLSAEENLEIFGKCNNLYGHGHNYYLQVTVQGEPDPVTGMLIRLQELDAVVEKQVMERFDHKNLNWDTSEFRHLNPTSENLIQVIWKLLAPELSQLYKLGLWETQKNFFEYYG